MKLSLLFTAAVVAALPAERRSYSEPPNNVTTLLVPAAFHIESHMDLLGASLANSGYPVRTLQLVSVNHAGVSVDNDAEEMVLFALNPLINQQGRDILLYLHSYSSLPGSEAIKGYSKAERQAAGKPGGIIGLIFQSAFIPHPGDTLVSSVGGKYPPWMDPQPDGLVHLIDPKSIFFKDTSEPLATVETSYLYPTSTKSFNSPEGPVYYTSSNFDNRRVYIRTGQDQAIPPSAQDQFLANSTVPWDVQRVEAGHDVFVSQPDTVAKIVEDSIAKFLATY